MFDTHCHLNFEKFAGKVGEIIEEAREVGVEKIVVPGTNLETSRKAIEIAQEYDGIYAAVGIHPHHVFELTKEENRIDEIIKRIFGLVVNKHVVAIGEIGLDRHLYQKTKYEDYEIDGEFIALQKKVLKKQIDLAVDTGKSLIIHNREATDELLDVLMERWDDSLRHNAVFHCCEPNKKLLRFAVEHDIFIGVDGDVTYHQNKKEFVKQVPLELLVVETDSPFLLPEPLRSERKFPNVPENLSLIVSSIAALKQVEQSKVVTVTAENGMALFGLS